MSITNTSKPSTTLTNTDRIGGAETWATITSTWATETRTWLDTGSLFDGFSKPTTSLTNISKPV